LRLKGLVVGRNVLRLVVVEVVVVFGAVGTKVTVVVVGAVGVGAILPSSTNRFSDSRRNMHLKLGSLTSQFVSLCRLLLSTIKKYILCIGRKVKKKFQDGLIQLNIAILIKKTDVFS